MVTTPLLHKHLTPLQVESRRYPSVHPATTSANWSREGRKRTRSTSTNTLYLRLLDLYRNIPPLFAKWSRHCFQTKETKEQTFDINQKKKKKILSSLFPMSYFPHPNPNFDKLEKVVSRVFHERRWKRRRVARVNELEGWSGVRAQVGEASGRLERFAESSGLDWRHEQGPPRRRVRGGWGGGRCHPRDRGSARENEVASVVERDGGGRRTRRRLDGFCFCSAIPLAPLAIPVAKVECKGRTRGTRGGGGGRSLSKGEARQTYLYPNFPPRKEVSGNRCRGSRPTSIACIEPRKPIPEISFLRL